MWEGDGTVAVVDDDPAVLDSLKFLLEVAGHSIATYDDGKTFLEDEKARPSCMILDHHMPGMSGLQLAAKLRADGWGLPILLVTGMPSPAISAEADRLGLAGVLEKPPYEEDILKFVCTNLDGACPKPA